jgi:aquaporin Z
MLDLTKFIAELFGTFLLISVIFATGKAIPIGLTLVTIVFLIGNVSGGHVNPAISAIMYMKGSIDLSTCTLYVVAQLLGGLMALLWYNKTKHFYSIKA